MVAKKDHKLVAHVDANTHKGFNALAERLGDRASALLRKLAVRAIQDDADGLLEARLIRGRKRRAAKSPD